MGMMYRNLDRKDDKELAKLRERAENVLELMRSGAL
jgi:deoxyribodipyrimidine photolyase-like uncharacterized protein